MENKNLKYFMRPEAKEELVVEVEGLESIKDEKGNVVPFKIKKLHNETVDKINKMYVTRVPAKDKKGNFIIQNGEIVYKVEKDKTKAFHHILVEALVYPDLKDKELMEYFGCHDITAAVRAFQRFAGLPESGVVTEITWAAIADTYDSLAG